MFKAIFGDENTSLSLRWDINLGDYDWVLSKTVHEITALHCKLIRINCQDDICGQ